MTIYSNLGTQRGHIHIYDITTRKRLQSICKHTNRVGVLAWNEWSICSGSRDRSILEHDIRQQPIVHTYHGHRQEVCGLKWSPDKTVLASGEMIIIYIFGQKVNQHNHYMHLMII